MLSSRLVSPSGGAKRAYMDKVVGRIEKSMKGCLRPNRDFRLSEIEPTTGSETASINVEIARTIPTSKAERPRT